MSTSSLPLYFKDIFLSAARSIGLWCIGLTVVAWLTQITNIVTVGLKSTDLYLDVVKLSTYILPHLISVIIPFAVLAGTVNLLYTYRKENKIIALQNLGISIKQIQTPFYILISVIVISHMILSLYFAPYAYKNFRDMQFDLKKRNIMSLIEPGVIKSDIPGISIYVSEKSGDNQFHNILISDTRDTKRIFSAESAFIAFDKGSLALKLKNGSYQEISNKMTTFLTFESYSLSLQDKNVVKKTDYNEFSLQELIASPEKHLLHQKIIWCLLSIFLTMLYLRFDFLYFQSNQIRIRSSTPVIIVTIAITTLIIMSLSVAKKAIQNPNIGLLVIYFSPILLLQITALMLKLNIKK